MIHGVFTVQVGAPKKTKQGQRLITLGVSGEGETDDHTQRAMSSVHQMDSMLNLNLGGGSFVRSFVVRSFVRSFVHSFVRSSIRPFIRSSVHSFARALAHSSVRVRTLFCLCVCSFAR